MDEHAIRLRGGWECLPLDRGEGRSARVTLPAAIGLLPPGRLRLLRRFQRPPRAADAPVVLRVDRGAGILSVSLNGRPIGPASPGRAEFELRLPPLEPRNELVIDAEPPPGDVEWGAFCLVFGPGRSDRAGDRAADA